MSLQSGTTWFRFDSVMLPTNVTYHHCIFFFRHNAIILSVADHAAEYLPRLCLKGSIQNLGVPDVAQQVKNVASIREDADLIPGGLGTWCCHKLQHRSQRQLRSHVAVAGVQPTSCSYDSTPSLGTSICCENGLKKKRTWYYSDTHSFVCNLLLFLLFFFPSICLYPWCSAISEWCCSWVWIFYHFFGPGWISLTRPVSFFFF